MRTSPLLRRIDAVTIPVPDLDSGVRFYCDGLGQTLLWRNETLGQAGLGTPDSQTEIVLTTQLEYAPNWLVEDVQEAVHGVTVAGGRVLVEPFDIPVGRGVVVADAFGNTLVLLDLAQGRYTTDESGAVTGVAPDSP